MIESICTIHEIKPDGTLKCMAASKSREALDAAARLFYGSATILPPRVHLYGADLGRIPTGLFKLNPNSNFMRSSDV